MHSFLLVPEVLVILFVHIILLGVLGVALYKGVAILRFFDAEATTQKQYALESDLYLMSSLMKLSLGIYFFLFFFIIYTINSLATLIPGAMCGAGVINANSYGAPLLILEFIIIEATLFWGALHHRGSRSKSFKFLRLTIVLSLFIYLSIFASLVLAFLFFSNLSSVAPVLCCSNLYTTEANQLPFGVQVSEISTLFYLNYLLIVLSLLFKRAFPLLVTTLTFLPLTVDGITSYFSPLIDDLPTHKCPFCILSSNYYSISYLIYGTLIFATYYSLKNIFLGFEKKENRKAVIFYTLYITILSFV